MLRGEVWWADLPKPVGRRPVLLLSRDKAIQVRAFVTVAELTRTVRDIPTEVRLNRDDGMPAACVVNLDVINTIPKSVLTERITPLSPQKLDVVEQALKFALALR